MKPVTIDDVAREANVSKSTVSQYLNGRYNYMSVKTKERIKQAISKLGYQPNILARSLKQGSTHSIGVIVANILHTFSTQVIRAIEDQCHEFGYHMIVCNADDDPEKEKGYINMLRAKQVDGMIIFPTGGNYNLYQKMEKEKYPLIFLDRFVKDLQISSVMLDNEEAAKLAVNHLAWHGAERIGLITTSITKNISPRIERIVGFRKALDEIGLPIQEKYIKSLAVQDIEAGLHSMLSLDKPPQAIIAGNDLSLIEILNYVKKKSINLPTDLALIGIDDVVFANFFTPSLTTVAQPTFEMGKKAATLLLNKIQGCGEEYQIYRFEPKLMIRESTY